jgi:hypothetical protein
MELWTKIYTKSWHIETLMQNRKNSDGWSSRELSPVFSKGITSTTGRKFDI